MPQKHLQQIILQREHSCLLGRRGNAIRYQVPEVTEELAATIFTVKQEVKCGKMVPV